MATQKKIDTVQSLTDKVSRAKAIVLVDYRGLKHKQLEDLRKALKKIEAEFTIAKNRLFKRALRQSSGQALRQSSGQALGDKAEKLAESLSQTTAILFSYADEVAPIKELLKFFKTAGAGSAKAGLLGNNLLSDADVTKLSSLPSRDMLLGTLVRQLGAPIQGLHYALSWNINTLVWAMNAMVKLKSQNSNVKATT